jgi:hypothetical protein
MEIRFQGKGSPELADVRQTRLVFLWFPPATQFGFMHLLNQQVARVSAPT